MDNCKNCAGTIGRDDVCQYCGTYHGPQKINTSSFKEPEVEHVQYGGLTSLGKIVVAMAILMIVFGTKYVFVDSDLVFKKEMTPAIHIPTFSWNAQAVVTDSNKMRAIMGDGDWALVKTAAAKSGIEIMGDGWSGLSEEAKKAEPWYWNAAMATASSTGEDKFIK
jgi:hypothetical protein